MTELEFLARDLKYTREDMDKVRRKQESMDDVIFGTRDRVGLQDLVTEISHTLKSLERMMRLVTFLAIPLAVLSLLISCGAVIVSVIAIGQVP